MTRNEVMCNRCGKTRLITYLENLGWYEKQILELLKFVRR